MKRKIALFLTVLFCITGFAAIPAQAGRLIISIGDQPYYTRGPGYWSGGVYWVWIPGHWCGWRHRHRIWCQGHYAPR
jgi:hypothetical protein